MRLIRPALLAILLFASAAHAGTGTGTGKATRYIEISNRAHDSVVSLEVAPAGSAEFVQVLGSRPMRGGGDSTTIKLRVEGCLHDMRLEFSNGRTLIYKDLDICSGGKLVIQPLPRRAISR